MLNQTSCINKKKKRITLYNPKKNARKRKAFFSGKFSQLSSNFTEKKWFTAKLIAV